MYVYGVFSSREAAEQAARQIAKAIPGAVVKRFSPTRRGDDAPDGLAYGTPGMLSGQSAFYAPYPMSFADAWSGHEIAEDRQQGQTALRVEVPNGAAAEKAVAFMRKAGGTGVRKS